MKKYIVPLLIFAFVLVGVVFISNQVSALSVPGCNLPGQPFSTTTGQSCGVVACATGDLFNSITGRACSVATVPICSRAYNSALQVGSKGDDVVTLQQVLKDAGLLFGNVDGVYGSMTEAARQSYNKKCSIPTTSATQPTRAVAASTTAKDSLPSCPGGYAQTLDTSNVESIAKSIAGGFLESKGYSSKYQSINAGIDGQYVFGNSSYGFVDACSDGVKMDFNADLKGTDRGGNACMVSIPSLACIRGLTGSINPTTTPTNTNTTNNNPTGNTPTTPAVVNGTIQGYSVHHVSNSDLRAFSTGNVKIDGGAAITTNPYSVSLAPGLHTVTAVAPSGYTLVGYTVGNSSSNPTPGSSASVNVTSGSTLNIWWHFTPVVSTVPTPTAKGTIQGHFVEDVNGNGQFDSGDKYIRDAVESACNSNETRESGFFIDYSGPSDGSAYLNKCDPSGTLYQVSVNPGSYTFTTHIPSGWTVVQDEAKTTKSTVNVSSGATVDGPWVYVRRNTTTLQPAPTGSGTIQGYSVHHVSNSDLRAFPSGSVTVKVNGGSVGSTSNNPYSFSLPSGTYTVSAAQPSGWEWATIGYTMCSGGFCHNGTVTQNSSVSVTVSANSSTDLWWHFGDASAMATVVKESQKASTWEIIKSWFGY